MIRALLILSVFLLSLSVAFAADGCYVGSPCTYYAYAAGGVSSDAYLSIFDWQGNSLIANENMNQINSETFALNYTHLNVGNFVAVVDFYNSTGLIGSGSESKEIVINTSEEINMFAQILEPFLLFAIGLLIALLGQYLMNSMFFIGSGVWFIGLAAAVFLGGVQVPILGGAFFALLGIGMVYHAIRTFLEEGK